MARIQGNKLTDIETVFIEAYLSNGYNRKDAVLKSGLITDSPSAMGSRILARPAVQKEMQKRIEKKRSAFFVQELDVLEGLYREANREGKGSTQSGRINAWVAIGKHLGMFTENKGIPGVAAGGTQINIVNYNSPQKEQDKLDNLQGQVVENLKTIPEPEKVFKEIDINE